MMGRTWTLKYCCAGLLILGLSACTDTAVSGKKEGADLRAFTANYAVARQALEEGNYGIAQREYVALLAVPTPLDARVRLEYAHALLRANDFEAAAEQAGRAAKNSNGALRAANQAVQATAQHEMALSESDPARARFLLERSHVAMKSALAHHKAIDPNGTLRGRMQQIEGLLGER